jgi:hypothetical protein
MLFHVLPTVSIEDSYNQTDSIIGIVVVSLIYAFGVAFSSNMYAENAQKKSGFFYETTKRMPFGVRATLSVIFTIAWPVYALGAVIWAICSIILFVINSCFVELVTAMRLKNTEDAQNRSEDTTKEIVKVE